MKTIKKKDPIKNNMVDDFYKYCEDNFGSKENCPSVGIEITDDDGNIGAFQGLIATKGDAKSPYGFWYVHDINDIIWIDNRKKKEENDSAVDVLKEINKGRNPTKQPDFKVQTEEDLITKSSDAESSNTSGVLSFIINENDNIIVKRLKELINSKKIRNDVITSKGYNYNVVYSLVKRNSIDFKTLEKWMDILGCEFDIQFKSKSGRMF